MKNSTTVIEKAKKVADESQFTVLENEKATLTKSLNEAKAAQDKAVTLTTSLQFEQERLIWMAKAEEKLA